LDCARQIEGKVMIGTLNPCKSRPYAKPSPWSIRAAAGALLLALSSFACATDAPVKDVESQINTQVWEPMLRASNEFDAEAFLAVLSRDLVRVSTDQNVVYGFERYSRETREGFARARERGLRRSSTMRFISRAHSQGLARETGIFRSEVVLGNGQTRVSFTAFEMILRQEAGVWKLLVDQDSWREGKITEAEYLAALPMNGDEPAAAPPTTR
jgi:hypothetical protein